MIKYLVLEFISLIMEKINGYDKSTNEDWT